MQIKEKDFVELDYTGILKETNEVYDTTVKSVAEKENIFNPKLDYTPVIICVGEKQLLEGLDERIVGKEVGKEYEFDLKPDEAFGRKDAKLLKLISTSQFLKQQIQPVPGLQINMDNANGIVRSVTGGRTLVDFNHPLAGKEVLYKIKVHKIVTDDSEKIKSLMKLELRIKPEHVKFHEGVVSIESKMDIPKEFSEMLVERLKTIVPSVKSVKFEVKKEIKEEKPKA